MKAEILGTFIGALFVGLIQALMAGLMLMWGLHNVHHYMPMIPALGYVSCVSIAIPFGLFIYISTQNSSN